MDIKNISEDLLISYSYPFPVVLTLVAVGVLALLFFFLIPKKWISWLMVSICLFSFGFAGVVHYNEIQERDKASLDYSEKLMASLQKKYDVSEVLPAESAQKGFFDAKTQRDSIPIAESSEIRSWSIRVANKFYSNDIKETLVRVKVDGKYYFYDLAKLGNDLALLQNSVDDPSPMTFKEE